MGQDTTTGVIIETRPVSLTRTETAWFQFVLDTTGGAVGDHILEVEALVAGDTNPGDNLKTKAVELQSVLYDIKVANIRPGGGSDQICPCETTARGSDCR